VKDTKQNLKTMKKIKLIALSALAFVTIASTVFVSCQKQQEFVENSQSTTTNTTQAKLTKDQELAIGWVDLAAGVASIETGPASLVISAAASMAYYQDKHASEGWNAKNTYNPNNYPSTTNNPGELHNLICEMYIQNGYTTVNYNDIKTVALNVKPDLESSLNNMSEAQFNYFVNLTKDKDLSTPTNQLDFFKTYFSINQNDEVVLLNYLETINNTDNEERISKIDDLINRIQSFDLDNTQKINLTNSFQILKHSSILWQH
jgi:hypothetical protein